MKGFSLWNDFVAAFLQELRSMSSEEIERFWSTRTERTAGYLSPDRGILPRVANRLNMMFKTETMRFDGEFWHREPGFPDIFAEVENDPVDVAESELEKLCYVRAPLKLVITISKWPDASLKDRWLRDIAECQKWLPESPEVVYGFVVGEAKSEQTEARARLGLFFHFFAASANGEVIEERPTELIAWFPERGAAAVAEG